MPRLSLSQPAHPAPTAAEPHVAFASCAPFSEVDALTEEVASLKKEAGQREYSLNKATAALAEASAHVTQLEADVAEREAQINDFRVRLAACEAREEDQKERMRHPACRRGYEPETSCRSAAALMLSIHALWFALCVRAGADAAESDVEKLTTELAEAQRAAAQAQAEAEAERQALSARLVEEQRKVAEAQDEAESLKAELDSSGVQELRDE